MKVRLIGNVLKKMVVCSVCTVTIASSLGVLSQASNWTDSEFQFTFQGNSKYTITRAKLDDSSSYMKCTNITPGTSYTAYVVGTKSPTDLNYKDLSGGHRYVFKNQVTHKMINYVYETAGYTHAAIACVPDYSVTFSASGLWSPDSI